MDSKLRKAAQAVLDEADNPLGQLPDFMTAIEALRVALSEKTDEATPSINIDLMVEKSERLEEMIQRHLDWIDRSDP